MMSMGSRVKSNEFCDVCQHAVYNLVKHRQTGEHRRNLHRSGISQPSVVDKKAEMRLLKGRRKKVLITPRQVVVLGLLMEGRSAKEVADVLKLSVLTVKMFITNARRRLGARNTTHAVVVALREGYVSLESSGDA